MPLRRRGFRRWLLDNYRVLYTLDLVAAYASLMFYFASLVLVGKPSALSRVCQGILVVSGIIAVLPLGTWFNSPAECFEHALRTHRPKKTERIEMVVAVGLWLMIAVAFGAAFAHSAHQTR